MKDNFSGGDNTWDERFQAQKNLYTIHANHHFSAYLKTKSPGRILLPGDGEGRNGVFAAKMGWEVTSFDYSMTGVQHALEFARSENVQLNALHKSIEEFQFELDYFDVIAIIFLHLPTEIRSEHFPRLINFLKPGGELYLLGFNKKQIKNTSGGPKNEVLLFDKKELEINFKTLEIIRLEEFSFELDEGPKHRGIAELVEMVGIKH